MEVIKNSIEKAELKEKEPRCDFCFIRDKEIIKCKVLYIINRLAIYILMPIAFPAHKYSSTTSSVTHVSLKYPPTPSASYVPYRMETFYSFPSTPRFSTIVNL